MKFGVRSTRFESGPNMTPLVDVVMVILIFLMLVGTFTAGEWVVQQNASAFVTATSSTAPPPDFVPDEPIIIRVTQPTPDKFVAQAERFTTSDKTALIAHLKGLREQLLKIGKKEEKLTIVIQPRPDVKHRHYMDVYDAALRADFKKVSFAVSQ